MAGCRAVIALLALSLQAGPATLEGRVAFRLVGSARLALVPAAEVMWTLQERIVSQLPEHGGRHTWADFLLLLCNDVLEVAVEAVRVVSQVEAQAAAALRSSVCRPEHLAAVCCRGAACLELCARQLGLGEA